jgi:CIC family chloride channel protein
MGASVGAWVARLARLSAQDVRDAHAAAAGASFGVAFGAPLGGLVFVFEELARRFRARTMAAALIACGVAITIMRAMASRTIFHTGTLEPPEGTAFVPFLICGCVAGAVGALYNSLILGMLDVFGRMARLPLEFRAGLVGALVGLFAWYVPALVGSGDSQTQQVLDGGVPLFALVSVFAIRFVLGPLSNAAGTPGGLFAPLLLLGAALGDAVGIVMHLVWPHAAPQPVAFAIVGMAAFYAGVIRAPLTGVVIVMEMTSSIALFAPMLIACFAALATTTVLKSQPLYDSLIERLIGKPAPELSAASNSMTRSSIQR